MNKKKSILEIQEINEVFSDMELEAEQNGENIRVFGIAEY